MEQIVTAYQLEPNALSEVISTLPHTQCWLNIDYGGHTNLFLTAAAAIRRFHESNLKKTHTHRNYPISHIVVILAPHKDQHRQDKVRLQVPSEAPVILRGDEVIKGEQGTIKALLTQR